MSERKEKKKKKHHDSPTGSSETPQRVFLVQLGDHRYKFSVANLAQLSFDDVRRQLQDTYSIGYSFDLQYYDAEVAEYLDFTDVSRCSARQAALAVARLCPQLGSVVVCSSSFCGYPLGSYATIRASCHAMIIFVALLDVLCIVVALVGRSARHFAVYGHAVARATMQTA